MDDQILSNDEPEQHLDLETQTEEEEYEEIDSDEVDSVISALEQLGNNTKSENIRHYIEEASNSIYYLVYSEEEDEDETVLEEAA